MPLLTKEQIEEINKSPGVGDYAADIAKGGLSGVGRGVVGIPGMLGDLQSIGEQGAVWLRGKMGGPEEAEALRQSQERAHQMDPANAIIPTSESMIQHATDAGIPGLKYRPETSPGRFAQTMGDFVGGALPTIGMGTAIQAGTKAERMWMLGKELLAQGIIPGAATEGAGQLAEKYVPGAETAARLVTGAGSSMAGSALTRPSYSTEVPEVGKVPREAAVKAGRTVDAAGGPAAALDEWNQVGPEGTLWDVGPRARGQAESLYITPGKHQQTMKDFLLRRSESLKGDDSLVAQTLNRYVEPQADNFLDQLETAATARRKQANTLFGDAEKLAEGKRIDTTPVIEYIESRLPTSVAANATDLLPREQEMLNLRGKLQNRTDYRSLKSAKEELDGMISEAKMAGRNTGPLIEVKNRLVDTLADATLKPDNTSAYREALRTYKTDSDIMEAMEAGQTLFERKQRPDQFARELRDMSDEQKTAMRMGARDNLAAIMGEPTNDFSAIQNRLTSNYARAKMRLLLGEKTADELYDRLHGLARQKGTVRGAEQKSATAGLLAGQKEITNPLEITAEVPLKDVPTPGQAGIGWLQQRYRNMARPEMVAGAEDVNNALAQIHTLQPQDRMTLLKELQRIYEESKRGELPTSARAMVGATSAAGSDSEPLKFSVGGRKKQ